MIINDSGRSAVTSVNGSTGAVTVQPTLVSGTNIKTINNSSILGSGNLTVGGGEWTLASGSLSDYITITNKTSSTCTINILKDLYIDCWTCNGYGSGIWESKEMLLKKGTFNNSNLGYGIQKYNNNNGNLRLFIKGEYNYYSLSEQSSGVTLFQKQDGYDTYTKQIFSETCSIPYLSSSPDGFFRLYIK